MRLALKVLTPLFLVGAVLAAVTASLAFHLRGQEAFLKEESRRLVGMMQYTQDLHKSQESIRANLLAYRFDRRQSRLDEIVAAERETAGALDLYATLVNDPQARALLQAFTETRSQLLETRHELIRAIQSDNEAHTRIAFDKWTVERALSDASMEDLSAYSVISLQGTVNAVLQEQIKFLRATLLGTALAILIAVAAFFYLRRDVGERLRLLTAGVDRVSLDDPGQRLNGSLFRSEDELAVLGRAFNRMAERIHAAYAVAREEIAERARAQDALERRIRLTQLMESLAGAANEADTPEDAMRACLARICEHGDWTLGRLAIFAEEDGATFPQRSFWQPSPPPGYPRFIAACGDASHFGAGGRFVSVVRSEKRPVWIEDMAAETGPGRLHVAAQEGLRSAFAFPIVVRGRVIAFLEFFSPSVRAPDRILMDAVASVGALIARVIERARASEERDRLNAELEERVARRTAELAASNRELDSFAYSVSHDLRAPLRAIDGYSRLLVDKHGGEIGAEAQHYLARVRENTQQMGRLIDDLLAFSRLGRQAPVSGRVDTLDLVRQCLNTLRPEFERRRTIIVLGDLPDCGGDSALVKQVWMNLLSNAFKFSGTRSPAQVEIGSLQVNGSRAFFVRDNGVGFDMRYADKLFGVFQRLHGAREFPGTGVGLAIVQRIVHRLGGRVWAEAAPDQGATFYFTLNGASNEEPTG